jgi:peptidoglycan/xylan/chitin deacetylase (PgdA/CDA1 family)
MVGRGIPACMLVDPTLRRLGSYGGEDSPGDISRVRLPFVIRHRLTFLKGMYAGEVGVPRLLKLFKKYNMKTTWFIPGQCRLSQSVNVCRISNRTQLGDLSGGNGCSPRRRA